LRLRNEWRKLEQVELRDMRRLAKRFERHHG
jgi:hypothetical protein